MGVGVGVGVGLVVVVVVVFASAPAFAFSAVFLPCFFFGLGAARLAKKASISNTACRLCRDVYPHML